MVCQAIEVPCTLLRSFMRRGTMWALVFCLCVVSGAPYKRRVEEDSYDVVYDQRQNGTENYRVNVDGLSLVWSPNSLIAAAALLEPALYGEYPNSNIDVVLDGTDLTKPEREEGNTTNVDEENHVKKAPYFASLLKPFLEKQSPSAPKLN